MKIIANLLVVTTLLFSCGSNRESLGGFEGWVFESFGSFLLATPPLKSLKDIHLEAGSLLNKAVVVNGSIERIGDQKTYLILRDDQGKLLVDLTNYYDLPMSIPLTSGQNVKIVGLVKSGRKGLFHVAAHALKVQNKPAPNLSRRVP